jgi:sarcosine/dimethylglycine N-methyltransferase
MMGVYQMSTQTYSETVDTARTYYNSEDADNFYYTVWGGEDIHVGLYQSADEPIFDASRRTVSYMASKLNLDKNGRVLDVGAGYGGAARFLANTYGCHISALNLSEVENERNRMLTEEQGLGHLIDVVDGSFENIPYPDASFDVVWSQDAILHSGDKHQVLAEVYRVLKPNGVFVFTDPMQSDSCPEGVLQPILDRIHLDSLGSPQFYQDTAKTLGFADVSFEDHTEQLVNHYGRVLNETNKKHTDMVGLISEDYIARMKKGLQHWIDGGRNDFLAWGIFVFKKS